MDLLVTISTTNEELKTEITTANLAYIDEAMCYLKNVDDAVFVHQLNTGDELQITKEQVGFCVRVVAEGFYEKRCTALDVQRLIRNLKDVFVCPEKYQFSSFG